MAKDLSGQAREILDKAEKHGVEQNFFFITTFKRYQVQITILGQLEASMKEQGTMVTKEYIKGRKNIYTNPAIVEYNKTSTAANQTLQTLIKIITTMRNEGDDDEAVRDFYEFVRGGRAKK